MDALHDLIVLHYVRSYHYGRVHVDAFAERLIDRSAVVRDHESGKIFRTSIEGMFYKVRAMASTWRLEVLMPETGQFLIGDNPAVTLSRDGTNTSYGVALGDANTLVLPIGPGHGTLASDKEGR